MRFWIVSAADDTVVVFSMLNQNRWCLTLRISI